MGIPQRAEIVIIGGGVVGASIAYHLAQRGKTDVTLVERKSLTNGSTWHAAGLVGQLRSSSSLTRLMRKSVETYQDLEARTGYATGWREVGGLRVAASPGRWEELQRVYTQGKSYGFDIHLVSPAEAGEIFPLLNTDGIYGATWTPSDGYVDPSQLTFSFITGARAAGVRVAQNCRVTGIERAGRRVTAVQTEQGRIECDVVVNATGMWGAETARLAGAHLAVNAVEHQYVVTEKSDGIPRDLPTFRDPDARFYLKPEAGGLVIGGWEEGTRACWRTIPYDLGPELFKPDTERFAGLAEGAANRVPIFGELGIQTWVNGPIPFSPDAEPVMGLTEDLDNLFHCCGFSAGIAAAGGAGDALANWIIDGDPGLDLWPFDVRRFGAPHNVPAVLETLSVQAYGHYYDIAYPNRPAHPPRGQRRSAVYDRLAERGAVFGGKFGFERANWFAAGGGSREETPTFGRSEAWPFIEAEHAAVRAAVGVIDQSSFAKFRIRGRGALGLLQKVAGADMDVAAGKVTYTQLLNARGGIEADVTVTRLGEEEFYLVTGSAFGRHDVTFLLQHAPADGSVTVDDVTSALGVLNVCGPRSRALAQSLSTADFGNEAFPYMTAQRVDLGWAPVLALRATYAGELGWEFHVPTEYVRDLYDKIVAAGGHLGLRDVGYRAVESLRLEKQYLAWAGDIKSDNNPYEAGLGFAVRPDKPALLAGPALRAIREAGPAQRLCWFTAEFPATGPDVTLHGGELLACPGAGVATSVRSAGFGFTVQRSIFSAYLPAEAAKESEFEIEVMNRRFPATRHERPLYDPTGARARSLSPFRYRRRRGLPLTASPKETPKTDAGGPMAARQHLSPDEHRPADDAELAEHGYRQRLNRSLGGFSSFAAGFSYISILTGMFQLFGFGYGFGGPILFWAWLIVFGGQFCVALVFAELSARYPIAGSVYQWSKKVSNPTGAWFAGWAMLAGSVVTVAAVSIALQIVLPQIWSGFTIFGNSTQNAVFLGCCAIVLTTIINVLGVRVMAFINNIGVAAELIGVALIIVLLLFHMHRTPAVIFTAQGAGPGLPGWTALGYLAPLLICAVMPAYVMFGFDTAGSLAEETKDPRRTTPSALLRALGAAGTAGALLLLMALLTAKSLAPATLGVGGLPSVLEDALGSGVGKVLLADVAFAIFICCLAIHAASIRLAFSMARDHALPFGDHLSHVSAQRKSPALPAIAVGAVAIAILVVNFGNAQIFLVVTSVSIVIVYIAYLLVTVPAMLQRRRNGWPEDQGRTGWFFLGRRRGLLINGTAIGYGLLMALNLIWPRAAIYGGGAYAWGGVIVVAAIMLIGAAYYFWRQHGRERQVAHEHRAEQLASAVGGQETST